jgi:cytochrome c peroxidase
VQLSVAETRGFEIFFTEKGDCFHCHSTILFTDNEFHNNGLDSVFADNGLFRVTGDPNDIGKFKTPTLRNAIFTSPYMHDGRFQTLEEVIDFYSEGLKFSSTIDPLMKNVNQGGVKLTDGEKEDLLAFIKTLTDTTFINSPDLSNPF